MARSRVTNPGMLDRVKVHLDGDRPLVLVAEEHQLLGGRSGDGLVEVHVEGAAHQAPVRRDDEHLGPLAVPLSVPGGVEARAPVAVPRRQVEDSAALGDDLTAEASLVPLGGAQVESIEVHPEHRPVAERHLQVRGRHPHPPVVGAHLDAHVAGAAVASRRTFQPHPGHPRLLPVPVHEQRCAVDLQAQPGRLLGIESAAVELRQVEFEPIQDALRRLDGAAAVPKRRRNVLLAARRGGDDPGQKAQKRNVRY